MGIIYEVSYNNYGEVTHCETVSYVKETETAYVKETETSFVKEAAREATETANQEASEER